MEFGTGNLRYNLELKDRAPNFYERVRRVPRKWVGDAICSRLCYRIKDIESPEAKLDFAMNLWANTHRPVKRAYKGGWKLHNWRQIEAKRLRNLKAIKWRNIRRQRREEILRKIEVEKAVYRIFSIRGKKNRKPVKCKLTQNRERLAVIVSLRATSLEEREIQRAKDKAERDKRIVAYYQRQERLRTPQRDRRIWLLRKEGFTLSDIGKMYCICRENVRRIEAKQDRMEIGRARKFKKLPSASGQTRPIDMGGPRGVWITCTPENPEGVIL